MKVCFFVHKDNLGTYGDLPLGTKIILPPPLKEPDTRCIDWIYAKHNSGPNPPQNSGPNPPQRTGPETLAHIGIEDGMRVKDFIKIKRKYGPHFSKYDGKRLM